MVTMRRTLLFLLALALTLGCGRSLPLRVGLDRHLDDEQRAAFALGMAGWNGLGTHPCFVDAQGEEPDVWVALEYPRVPDVNGEYREGRIYIPPDIGGAISATSFHELGHALGMNHTRTGVMSATVATTEFSDDDRAEFRRIGGCP